MAVSCGAGAEISIIADGAVASVSSGVTGAGAASLGAEVGVGLGVGDVEEVADGLGVTGLGETGLGLTGLGCGDGVTTPTSGLSGAVGAEELGLGAGETAGSATTGVSPIPESVITKLVNRAIDKDLRTDALLNVMRGVSAAPPNGFPSINW